MSATGIQAFDHTLHLTNIWLKELMDELEWSDRQPAYHALRAVLHTLRDRLGVDEAANLGAQLPMLVRGFYFEGWHPAGKPLKWRSRDKFLAHLRAEMPGYDDAELERITCGVLRVISSHIADGEALDVRDAMPEPLRDLWPM